MSEPYIGEIRMFAGNYAPVIDRGENYDPLVWHLCDGAELQISKYQELYAVIGTRWGGDGRTTFGLPDLRGRVAVGQGAGAGLSPRSLAGFGGAATVTLTEAQMGPHTHAFYATATAAETISPQSSVPAAYSPRAPQQGLYVDQANVSREGTFDPRFLGLEGSNGAVLNLMPSFAVTFIIALYGNFPTRS